MPDKKIVQVVNSESPKLNIFSVILAAGSASRFGAPKQLAEYQGQSLVGRAVDLGQQANGQQTVLVVGAEWQQVVEDCRSPAPFIARNENFDRGMASSIACGVRAVIPVADAVLILLADQPLITSDHLSTLRAAWLDSPCSIVASSYSDIVGPPVIFPSVYFDALLNLRGDAGARSVIENNSQSVIEIPFADAAIDIDTPSDLHNI